MVAETNDLAEAFRAGRVDIARMTGLSDDEVEAGYQRGRTMLENGLNEQAATVLLGIAILRPTEPRYVRGLAFAYHRLHHLAIAHALFEVVLHLDATDRISQFMRAECALVAVGREAGRQQLNDALEAAPLTAELRPYEQRARALLKMVQQTP